MGDNKERDRLRKREEKELRDFQKKYQEIISSESESDSEKKLVKRYTAIVGVGSFICTGCILDSAKNIIGIEVPEILEIESHDESDEDLTELAFGCLVKIIENKKPSMKMFIVDPRSLQENKVDGVLFLGVTLSEMKEDETRSEFFERVKNELMRLDLLKTKADEDMSEEDRIHYEESFNVNYLTDVCVNYTEQTDETDIDDHDVGYLEGINDGIDEHYYLVQVALYKMSKTKKLRNLETFLDELHNTINGMDESEMLRYSKAYQKYLKKLKKKEIEGD